MQDITKATLAAASAGADLWAFFHLGLLKIEQVEDSLTTFADLCGDCFCPLTNPDIDPAELARQKRAYRARVARQGIHGAVLFTRARPCAEWVESDSIFGFVGSDFIGSGYDGDFLASARTRLNAAADLGAIRAALGVLG